MRAHTNNKIVFLLVFLCAAIMSSVFVYRATHKPGKLITLSHEAGTLFPTPRDIKSFELINGDNAFTERDLRSNWTLVFFGFTHCANVCPTTLNMISQAYPTLKRSYPNLQVALVSLDPERDSIADVKTYANRFHPDFLGLTGKLKEIRKLQAQFNIYSMKEVADEKQNYQIEHTSSILLVNPHGKWVGLYPYGLTSDQFINAFKESMKVLT